MTAPPISAGCRSRRPDDWPISVLPRDDGGARHGPLGGVRADGQAPTMKIFVTGGSGLVGSTVIDMLLARGDDVLAIDNFATGRRDNLAPHPRLRLVEDSIADRRVVDRLIGDFRPEV